MYIVKGNLVIVGASGYWGSNLVRTAVELFGADHVIAVDLNQAGLEVIAKQFDGLKISTNLNDVLLDNKNNYFIIATPPELHHNIAMQVLTHKKNILITKPVALNTKDAEEIHSFAIKQGVVAMVDHTFLFHPAITALVTNVQSGIIGIPKTFYAEWLSRGKIQQEVDVIWDLAPHPLSILLEFWEFPIDVSCQVHDKVDGVPSEASLFLNEKRTGNSAIIHVSWMDGGKSRMFKIRGSHNTVVFDDTNEIAHKLVLRGGKITGQKRLNEGYEGPIEDLEYPTERPIAFKWEEPLKRELSSFVTCAPQFRESDPMKKGIACVKLIEAAHTALKQQAKVTCK